MNKSSVVVQNSAEAVPKDTLHNMKKGGSTKESLPDTTPDDSDRAQGHYSKITSHFDYSNLGLFFGARPSQPKVPSEGVIGKVETKKKLSEPSSGKDVPALKHQSSKDFSNLDELCENTTIINNPSETKSHSKKKSNDMTFPKNADEDVNDISQTFFLDNSFLKHHSKNKSREKSFSSLLKGPKDDKIDQEIAHDIFKLGLDANPEDHEKSSDNLRDLKVSKNNLKVLERIKTKALPNRQPLSIPSASDSQQPSSPKSRNIFNGTSVNKPNKGVAMSPLILQYQDQEVYNDDSSAQDEFIKEFFETSKNRNSSDDIPLDKSKEISHDDLNPHLLTEKTTNKNPRKVNELNLDSSRDIRQRPNISLVSTDSTIDSENLNHHNDHQNNSFSTPFSGASGSFNNSGKLDLSSPLKDPSARIHSENSEINYMNTYSLQRNMSMLNNSRMSMIPPQQQQQQQQRMSANLNQSCMSFHGGYGSGNNSDRSNNLSFNGSDDFLQNAFSNDFTSHRARTPQSFINQNFNVSSNPNIMDQFFIAPQGNNFNMMNQSMTQQPISNSTPSSTGKSTPNSKTNSSNNNNSNDNKNQGRSKRRTQEAEEGNLYDINIDRIDISGNGNGRTTVMIRNIPNKYDLPLIAQTIDKNHKGKYDFFYLPIDFSNRCNFGYAFINFTDTKFIKDFYLEFNGKKWEKFNSEKICEIKYARIQGYSNLMQHFQYSRVMNQQDKKLRPYIPPKLSGLPNKQKIEELVRQQKLESANNGKEKQSR